MAANFSIYYKNACLLQSFWFHIKSKDFFISHSVVYLISCKICIYAVKVRQNPHLKYVGPLTTRVLHLRLLWELHLNFTKTPFDLDVKSVWLRSNSFNNQISTVYGNRQIRLFLVKPTTTILSLCGSWVKHMVGFVIPGLSRRLNMEDATFWLWCI